jgi:hypothetical protein
MSEIMKELIPIIVATIASITAIITTKMAVSNKKENKQLNIQIEELRIEINNVTHNFNDKKIENTSLKKLLPNSVLEESSIFQNDVEIENSNFCDVCKNQTCALPRIIALGTSLKFTITIPFYDVVISCDVPYTMLTQSEKNEKIYLATKLKHEGMEYKEYKKANENGNIRGCGKDCNEIHIGSPIANNLTAEKLFTFGNFEIFAPENTIGDCKCYNKDEKILKRIVKVSQHGDWSFNVTGRKPLICTDKVKEVTEEGTETGIVIKANDYAVLIKYNEEEKSVHLLFGLKLETTILSVSFLQNNHGHNIFEDNPHKYCIFIPCIGDGFTYDKNNKLVYYDYTKEFFGH